MPGFNRTGPNGEGPMTGGGFGNCGNPQAGGGMGRRFGGKGAGFGGRCRGGGGRRMGGMAPPSAMPTSQAPVNATGQTDLAQRAAFLRAELDAIENALKDNETP